MKSIISILALITLLLLTPNRGLAADWWTISDKDFATEFAKQATSDTIEDQSNVAWMLFARVNQPVQNQGQPLAMGNVAQQ